MQSEAMQSNVMQSKAMQTECNKSKFCHLWFRGHSGSSDCLSAFTMLQYCGAAKPASSAPSSSNASTSGAAKPAVDSSAPVDMRTCFGKQGRLPFAASGAAKPASSEANSASKSAPCTNSTPKSAPSTKSSQTVSSGAAKPASPTTLHPGGAAKPASSTSCGAADPASFASTNVSATHLEKLCEACALRGQTHERNSAECRELQLRCGCHACDRLGCWTGSGNCKFHRRGRVAHDDADFGDNRPHMAGEKNIQILRNGTPLTNGQRMPARWFAGHSVLVRIDDKEFTMGEASGDGCNCLISTLMQCLNMVCKVPRLRSELERLHFGKATHIKPGDYLDLKEHWRDIVDLLGQRKVEDKNVRATCVRIICTDVNLPGHGDVLPTGKADGRMSLYIARQNLNHFVPLIRLWGHHGAGYTHRPEQSSGAAKPASASGAAEAYVSYPGSLFSPRDLGISCD